MAKRNENPGQIDSAHVLVPDDDSARAEYRSSVSHLVEVQVHGHALVTENPAERPTGLEQLESFAVRDSAADVVYDLSSVRPIGTS